MNSRLGVTGIAFLFVLATLAACGGGGGNGGSATAPPPNNVAGFAYVLDSGSGQVAGSKVDVSAYTIDASTGALSQATGSRHVTTQAGNVAGFAHVSNSDDVSAYGINTSASALAQIARRQWSPIGRAMSINANAAALAPFAGTTIAAGVFAVPSTVDPSGRFAYVLNYAADNISAYAFDPRPGRFRKSRVVHLGREPRRIPVAS